MADLWHDRADEIVDAMRALNRRAPCALIGCIAAAAIAQQPDAQRGGTYVEPPAVDPVYLPAGPDLRRREEPAAAHDPFSVRLAFDYPLRSSQSPAAGSRQLGSPPVSPTLQATVRYQPWADSYWFAQTTLLRYLQPHRQQPWNPDFTYVLGYDDWHPGTYSFTYSNYSGTRFDPDLARREHRWNFPNGQWSFGYKDALPDALAPWLLVGDGDTATCSTAVNLTPRYTQLSGATARDKTSVALGCRYARPSGVFVQATLVGYPRAGQQQPWDPDFTYSFGYYDWRPGSFSIQYSNYSGNRLPGRTRAPGQGTLRNGSITVSWSAQW